MKKQTLISELIESKQLPKWLSSNAVFKSLGSIEKVFPSIGLANMTEPCKIEGNFATSYATTLLNAAKSELRQAFDELEAFKSHQLYENERMMLLSVISQVDDAFVDGLKDFIVEKKGKIELQLPVAFTTEDATNALVAVSGKGVAFFDFYQGIRRVLSSCFGIAIRDASKLASYKDFNASNFLISDANIVFSSDGSEGLWDILTMSMRGIKSCVRWDGAHKLTLIGSMADPYTGIIYLTSEKKEKLGTHMAKRCLVRFVIDGENDKPYLLIDRMYPTLDMDVLSAFKEFIERKTSNRFDIIYGPTMDEERRIRSYIPNREITSKLNEQTFSYRDTKLPIGKRPSKISERRDTNLKIKLHNLIIRLKKELLVADCANLVANPDMRNWILRYKPNIVADYGAILIDEALKALAVDKDATSDECFKRICFSFLTQKQDIVRGAGKRFMRDKQVAAVLVKKDIQPLLDAVETSLSKVIKSYTLSIITGADKVAKKTKKARKKAVVQ